MNKRITKTEITIGAVFTQFLAIGLVWLFVWLFNPNLETTTVWLIALMYGAIQSNIYVITAQTRKASGIYG